MRTIQEIITEAKFWEANGLGYNDIRAMLECAAMPLTENEWDQVMWALDMEEFGRVEHETAKYDSFEGDYDNE